MIITIANPQSYYNIELVLSSDYDRFIFTEYKSWDIEIYFSPFCTHILSFNI